MNPTLDALLLGAVIATLALSGCDASQSTGAVEAAPPIENPDLAVEQVPDLAVDRSFDFAVGVEPDLSQGTNPDMAGAVYSATVIVGAASALIAGIRIPETYAIAAFGIITNALERKTVAVGPCLIETDMPQAGQPQAVSLVSAGNLLIKGGAYDIGLAPMMDDSYPYFSDMKTLAFTGGQMMTVTATGGDVPPFKMVGRSPTQVDLTAPAPAFQQKLTFDHNVDLGLAWSNGVPGDVFVFTMTQYEGQKATRVTCSFDAGSGSATIPKAAMVILKAGDAHITATTGVQAAIAAGLYTVNVSLLAAASTAGQSLAIFQAVLQ